MIAIEGVTVTVDGMMLVEPVSARVERGQTLAVRGRNGSGKSTLLRVVAGRLKPTAGSVAIGGMIACGRDRGFRRRMSAMLGPVPWAADLTASDHVLMVASTWFDDPARARAVAAQLLEELDLVECGRRFPHELSSGQLQLLGLALALARPFDVLVLDEPEQRLDPQRLQNVVAALARRRKAGAAMVVATHHAALADALSDETVWLGRAA